MPSALDNRALCTGMGGSGRWAGHGSMLSTAVGAWHAGLPSCDMTQPATSLQILGGSASLQLFGRKDSIENFREWVISECVLLKRSVELFL